MRPRAVRLALGLCLALAGCRAGPAPAPPNVVLVVIDTLRADRLGVYGNRAGLTPFLDQLAARAVVYQRAYAQSSWTNASIATLWTSRFQSQHGILDFSSVLSADELTLPEILQAQHYATGGFSANIVLAHHLGFAQGFDRFRADMKGAAASGQGKALAWRVEDINRQALTWIDSLPAAPRAPLFLHLQYMEPHAPYQPPADLLAARFGDQVLDLAGLNFTALYGVRQPAFDIRTATQVPPGYAPPTAETLAGVTALYDIAVRSVDRGIRTLFADLEARGILRNALVIVTSDHGEQFLEHGGMGHKRSLYNEEIQVPLLVLLPGQTQRVDIEAPVGLVDVAPTVLAWVGVAPPAAFEGRVLPGAAPPDFRPAAPQPARPVFSELLPGNVEHVVSPHQRAALSDTEKLILRVDGSSEFYDLARDPGEQKRDIAPAAGGDLRAQVQEFRRVMTRVAPAESKPLDAQTTERLRALGYEP